MKRINPLFAVIGILCLSIGCNPLPKETVSDIDTSFEGIRKVSVQGEPWKLVTPEVKIQKKYT